MIVDSQVHLWRAETPDRPWPAGGAQRAHLPEPLTFPRMAEMMRETGVDRCIIVPPSWEGDRNDYALQAAAEYPDRFAVMGRVALDDPGAAELLPDWKKQRGMLGVRLTFMGGQSTWLEDGTADWFWPAAAAADIPVMIHAPGKMPLLKDIARRWEGLTLIIDHMGLNHKMAEEGRCAAGVSALLALAELRNVRVKVSAAANYSHLPYPFTDMDEHIKRVIDSFGAERCFWGTDFTHSPNKGTYAQRKTHFTEHLDFLTASERALVMGDALLACLGWAKN